VVSADDLDSGSFGQPGREGVSLPVRQEVHGAPCLDVDEYGSVDLALALGVFVDAEHAGRGGGRIRQ
jgi:hypothetical protein